MRKSAPLQLRSPIDVARQFGQPRTQGITSIFLVAPDVAEMVQCVENPENGRFGDFGALRQCREVERPRPRQFAQHIEGAQNDGNQIFSSFLSHKFPLF
jgi:hypothetical protein